MHIIIAILVSAFIALGITAQPSQYDKPIDTVNGGDPCIAEDESGTYYTFTTGGGIDIFQIESYDRVNVTRQKTVFWAGESGTVKDIWAPEIHKIGNRWYIIACGVFSQEVIGRGTMPMASGNDVYEDFYRYAFVLESSSEDIFSDYTFKGILAPDGLNNIDGTYLFKNGKLYYVCSAYLATGFQALYICEMENPYTLKADENGRHNAVEISRPEHLWEKRGWSVNEGPAALYHGDDTYIVYSASGFSSGNYCMGLLALKGDDVMVEDNWVKTPVSVLSHQPLKKIYNPGHCSFLYRENGDIIMVYHANGARKFDKAPQRLTYIKPVEFVGGVPVLR